MYGTIARLQVKSGVEQQLQQIFEEQNAAQVPGFRFGYIYRTDADPNVYMMVVGFDSKEAYFANADSPEQHQRYLKLRALLEADPEWTDGEIVGEFRA